MLLSFTFHKSPNISAKARMKRNKSSFERCITSALHLCHFSKERLLNGFEISFCWRSVGFPVSTPWWQCTVSNSRHSMAPLPIMMASREKALVRWVGLWVHAGAEDQPGVYVNMWLILLIPLCKSLGVLNSLTTLVFSVTWNFQISLFFLSLV